MNHGLVSQSGKQNIHEVPEAGLLDRRGLPTLVVDRQETQGQNAVGVLPLVLASSTPRS